MIRATIAIIAPDEEVSRVPRARDVTITTLITQVAALREQLTIAREVNKVLEGRINHLETLVGWLREINRDHARVRRIMTGR